jgi:hypothetical protein
MKNIRFISIMLLSLLLLHNNSAFGDTSRTVNDTAIINVPAKNADNELSKTDYKPIITIILGLITLVLTYYGQKISQQNSLLQKNQWHTELFTRFFIEETYKQMRYILDFKPKLEFGKLLQSLEPDCNDRISEEFYDYLNFFEFIASMWKSKQIEYSEIISLFRYYLLMLSREKFIRDEIRQKNFDFLDNLLNEMERREMKRI